MQLQAAISLSHFCTETATKGLLNIVPANGVVADYYIDYALKEAFRFLRPVWIAMFKENKSFLSETPEKAAYLLGSLTQEKDLEIPGHVRSDPAWHKYQYQALSSKDLELMKEAPAVAYFLGKKTLSPETPKRKDESTDGKTIIRLSAVPARMIFDKSVISVKAGSMVSLIFSNTDEMPHNVVITSPGAVQKVGTAADAMAAAPDGYQKHFVPAIPEVLYSTPLVQPGESFTLDFKAPLTKGDYPFVCTFPGHWQVMKGIIKIEP